MIQYVKVIYLIEEFYRDGKVRHLGMSNTYDINTLKAIYDAAEVKPTILQNRFYKKSGYDKEIRKYCLEKQIHYESFWTLTANPKILQSQEIHNLGRKYEKTAAQVFFRFVKHLGITPLSGTKNIQHMQEDLDLASFALEEDEVKTLHDKLFSI